MLALYGHPFSSYTWKAQIALHASGLDYELRVIDAEHPEYGEFVQNNAGPLGLFPVLVDGANVLFEASCIIEYLSQAYPCPLPLLAADPHAAIGQRMLDRVFDNYVMTPMNEVVREHIRPLEDQDMTRCDAAKERLRRSYAWIESWLAHYAIAPDHVTLIECAAAPSLFYADWVEPISEDCPRLRNWRQHLNALPAVSRCIEAARPFRAWFPPGAPDRD